MSNFHLKTVRFVSPFFCFQPGNLFEFRPGINVIVGDQGAGKSSLLKVLDYSPEERNHYVELEKGEESEEKIRRLRFDSEKDNPRIGKGILETATDLFSLNYRFMSHGEATLDIFKSLEDKTNMVLFLDEPETSLSPSSIVALLNQWKILAEKNHVQILCATHSPLIICSVPQVLDLTKRQWTDSIAYLKEAIPSLDLETRDRLSKVFTHRMEKKTKGRNRYGELSISAFARELRDLGLQWEEKNGGKHWILVDQQYKNRYEIWPTTSRWRKQTLKKQNWVEGYSLFDLLRELKEVRGIRQEKEIPVAATKYPSPPDDLDDDEVPWE